MTASSSWSKVVDSATGAAYWWDSSTGAVSWSAPDGHQPEADQSPWVSVVDKSSRLTYWWNQQTDERSWTAPRSSEAPANASGGPAAEIEPEAHPAPAPAPAALPSLLQQRLARRGLAVPGSLGPHSQGPGQPAERPAPACAVPGPITQQPVLAMPTPPLPPGWLVQRDPSGRVFYIHPASGHTSWTPPSSAPPVPGACSSVSYAGQPPIACASAGGSSACRTAPPTAAPLPTKDIVAIVEARDMAKKKKDFEAADQLRAQLTSHGVSIDDRARSWRCSDGRSGLLPGGRVGPTVPAALAGAVDSRGRVSAAAVAAAANAAAAGWCSGAGVTGTKRSTPSAQKALTAAPMSAGRAAKEARLAARSAADPLDPSSWEGYEVPRGGWSGPSRVVAGAAASGSHKGLPTPGEILRMNSAQK